MWVKHEQTTPCLIVYTTHLWWFWRMVYYFTHIASFSKHTAGFHVADGGHPMSRRFLLGPWASSSWPVLFGIYAWGLPPVINASVAHSPRDTVGDGWSPCLIANLVYNFNILQWLYDGLWIYGDYNYDQLWWHYDSAIFISSKPNHSNSWIWWLLWL